MTLVHIKNFGNGLADDYTSPKTGESAISKNFDILSYPNRLQPLRGMNNDSPTEDSDTGIGNMILASNGAFYGIGVNPLSTDDGELYKRTGTGASDKWEEFAQEQHPGGKVYDFLVYYPEMTATRKIFWSATNTLCATDSSGLSSVDIDTLNFLTIGQGLVHPKDKILYFPYQTSTTTYIGKIGVHGSDPFGNVNYTAFELSNRYRSYNLTHFGDYLAVPMTTASQGSVDRSIVGFWDRDTSLTTFNETIPWGEGGLRVLNNLNGYLIGISDFNTNNDSIDSDKIQVKIYAGGSTPFVIKEIIAQRLTSTTPTCTINPRVNFIHNSRLYFSVNIVYGGSAPAYYGLWSVGINKAGNWTVTLERGATNDNTETGIIAAAMTGDFLTCAHTTEGNLTHTQNGIDPSTTFDATAFYETGINPEMRSEDKFKKKQLVGVYVTYLPLLSDGQVILKYRMDSDLTGSWTTIFTDSEAGSVATEKTDVSGNPFIIGRNIEFRLESTGGAVITGLGYNYEVNESLL